MNAIGQTSSDPLAVECEECGELGKALSTCKHCGAFIPISLGLDDDVVIEWIAHEK